jgi:hypothetical protein
MIRSMKWVGAITVAVSVLLAPAAFAANVEDVTSAQIEAHHITVSNWSLLIAYLGYHAVSSGHLKAVTRNIETFWREVGSSNPGDQTLSHKVEELNLLAATARLADADVAVVNSHGQPVSWTRYMKSPHRIYHFAIDNRSTGQVLSTISVPWQDPSTKIAAVDPKPKAKVAKSKPKAKVKSKSITKDPKGKPEPKTKKKTIHRVTKKGKAKESRKVKVRSKSTNLKVKGKAKIKGKATHRNTRKK